MLFKGGSGRKKTHNAFGRRDFSVEHVEIQDCAISKENARKTLAGNAKKYAVEMISKWKWKQQKAQK